MPPFLLCDPALMVPAPNGRREEVSFWAKLIEWSDDTRLRLGPAGHHLAVELFAEQGNWPNYDATDYPNGLGRLAFEAISKILGRVATGASKGPEEMPLLDPAYRAHEGAGSAVAKDGVSLADLEVIGIATHPDHWERSEEKVAFEPPPPDPLRLIYEPNADIVDSPDDRVTRYLEGRRLTIVGGLPNESLPAELERSFGATGVRWIEATGPGGLSNLEALQPQVDIVYCITDHLSHADSIKAKKCCYKRGIRLRKVGGPHQVVADLRHRHGS